jgi:hypothetical protein
MTYRTFGLPYIISVTVISEEMMTAMQSRGLNIEDAQDRQLWRIGTGRQH